MNQLPSASHREANPKPAWRNLLESLLLAFLAYLVLANYVVLAYEIPSGSMIPTLQIGDRLLVSRFAYDLNLLPSRVRIGPVEIDSPWGVLHIASLSQPKRGEIVVFHEPKVNTESMIKRVLGLPGETIEVRDSRIYINGQAIADPWGRHLGGRLPAPDFGPVTIPAEHYFVMGDNRDNSYDSRAWFGGRGGFVARSHIQGRAWLIYWPGPDMANGQRWSRAGLLGD